MCTLISPNNSRSLQISQSRIYRVYLKSSNLYKKIIVYGKWEQVQNPKLRGKVSWQYTQCYKNFTLNSAVEKKTCACKDIISFWAEVYVLVIKTYFETNSYVIFVSNMFLRMKFWYPLQQLSTLLTTLWTIIVSTMLCTLAHRYCGQQRRKECAHWLKQFRMYRFENNLYKFTCAW